MENIKIISGIVLTIVVLYFLIKSIFRNRKKEIAIEVKSCLGCPFKDKKDGMLHYTCRLRKIIYNREDTFMDLESMKCTCPQKGEFKIKVK